MVSNGPQKNESIATRPPAPPPARPFRISRRAWQENPSLMVCFIRHSALSRARERKREEFLKNFPSGRLGGRELAAARRRRRRGRLGRQQARPRVRARLRRWTPMNTYQARSRAERNDERWAPSAGGNETDRCERISDGRNASWWRQPSRKFVRVPLSPEVSFLPPSPPPKRAIEPSRAPEFPGRKTVAIKLFSSPPLFNTMATCSESAGVVGVLENGTFSFLPSRLFVFLTTFHPFLPRGGSSIPPLPAALTRASPG